MVAILPSIALVGFILTAISIENGLAFWSHSKDNSIDTDLKELFDRVMSTQALKSKNYTPPFSWSHKLGLFESDIRIMLSGGPVETEFRSTFAIYDNDMFSTGW
jgi:hypothetical protein